MTAQISNGVNNEKHPEGKPLTSYGAGYCRINKNGFALATGGVMGVIYILCAIFVALWPGFALQLFGWLAHLVNVEKFASDVAITTTGFIWGLVQAVIYTYISAWLIAWLHNKFCAE